MNQARLIAEHQRTLRELWKYAWLACCTSSNRDKLSSPALWADRAVAEYDKRFNPEHQPNPAKSK